MSPDLVRYRPVLKGKDAEMRPDESGDWTSLSCYYLLHDRLARTEEHLKAAIMAAEANRNLVKQLKDQLASAKAENERLRKAGDALADKVSHDEKMLDEDWGLEPRQHTFVASWHAAKGITP